MRVWRRFICERSGLTLLELLVAMGIALVTLTATLGGLEMVIRQQPRISEHGLRVQEARAALERLTRDLRGTYSINSSSSTYLDVLTYLRVDHDSVAVQRRVIYDCSSNSCTRQEGPTSGALDQAQKLIDGVDNADIFDFEPDNVNASVITVKFAFDVKHHADDPTGAVTLSEGVQLRNTKVPT